MQRRYNVRKFLGMYQREKLLLWGKIRFRKNILVIERFFDAFPEKKYLTQFKVEDLHDWSITRRNQGLSPASVAWELSLVRGFWKWATEDKELIVLGALEQLRAKLYPPQTGQKRNKKALNSLDELRAIYFHITGFPLREYILAAIRNDKPLPPKPLWFTEAWNDAANRAGLDYRFGDFTHSLKLVRRWIAEYFNPQVGDALALKAKTDGDSLGAVNVSPANIWPSVGNYSEYDLTVYGIGQLQQGPKGHTLVGNR